MTPKKVDKGFELFYWNLSYRRKFIRTTWILIIGSIIIWFLTKNLFLIALVSIVSFIQMFHTYNKWKAKEKEEEWN